MKPTRFKIAVVATAVIVVSLFVYLRSRSDNSPTANSTEVHINPEFAGYIGSFTSGFISSHSTIKIKFISEISPALELNKPLEEKLFAFEPKIAGHAEWKDAQTLEFIPDERMPSGQLYKATFFLSKLADVKKELREFDFQFQIVDQSMQMSVNDLKSYNSNDFSFYSLSGNISTADMAAPQEIEKTLSAGLDFKAPKISWIHDEAGLNHRFIIDSIQRQEAKEGEIHVNCNGSSFGLDFSRELTFKIPARDAFSLLNVDVILDGDPNVLLVFSNPLDAAQSLEGLIRINGINDVKYLINNNQVTIYPANTRSGSYVLKVSEAVKDARGNVLGFSSEHSIVFSQVNPSLRFVGSGNILASTGGMMLNFETVNLKAVDVKVVKIYENNVLQFLQNNRLDGSSQLAQVGKQIIKRRISLGISNPGDFGVWKRTSLDLSKMIKSEPGAIYRVTLSARKEYSSYPCAGATASDRFELATIPDEEEEEEEQYFGYYNEYNDYYDEEYEDYDWSERDDPCKSTYYRQSERIISKNILATDLGLTLKKANDGSLLAVVADLVSAEPVGNVSIELYDYQQQLLEKASTDAEGKVFLNPPQRPWFVIARKNKMFTYLRIDDGAVLSLSSYDVAGEAIKKGIKGFIYGERGVWRPGDSLFLTFMLEDKMKTLPENHPVVFELYNPQSQLYKRLLSNKGKRGFYSFATVTDKNSPTGVWTAQVKVGSQKFSKSIRVENVMPNRLKIDLTIGSQDMIVAGKENTIKLHTNWLTGATAKNLNAKITVALSSMQTEFTRFKDYNFDNVAQRFDAQLVQLFDGQVDEQGNATIPMALELENNAPGLLRAAFNTQVFEPGGAFSVDHHTAIYSSYTDYVGLKLPDGEKNSGIIYTNRNHNIKIATVDAKGNPVSRSSIKFEMFKLQWRWWWDQSGNELANYASDSYHQSVRSEIISTKNGNANIQVNIPNDKWGRYLIRLTDTESGHVSSQVTYFDWANWMDRSEGNDNQMSSNMLSFTTDKPSYKTGEEVKVTIPSPKDARALITIENGSRVLEAHWMETGKTAAVFKFKVTAGMAPNVYVHVSLLQPHARSNDLPIRSYGVVPVIVDDPDTHLEPQLSMPNVLEPEKMVQIAVSEAKGKEMAFTLAVVEEGLLDLTRFKTPDPFKNFYAKEALGVKTWDIYDDVIGAYGTDLERILSIGGDGSDLNNDAAKANRFKPMVRFFGPFVLGKNEKKNISFRMPMYVGSVRTMLIAGNNGSYGFAEKTTAVKAPLMVLGTLPRVLSVGEEVKLPVSIFGGDKDLGNTEVKVEVSGLLQIAKAVQNTSVKKNEEKLVTFDIKVKNQVGIARVKITAKGGGHSTVYEMELDVRNPNPYQVQITDFSIEPGKTLDQNFSAFGFPGTNSGVLEVSSLPPINLGERLKYLVDYPHGCIEQTTSQSFAQLYLPEIVDMTAEQKSEIERNVNGGISLISNFQLSSGAMSYWPGMQSPSDWGTSYAGHFLLLAEKSGYSVPSGLLKKWNSYQQSTAQSFEFNDARYYNNDVLQAYRLYVLSLAKTPLLGAMNRLREYSRLSNQAKWLLASAYAEAGQTDEAEKLIVSAGSVFNTYHVDYYTYGSTQRDMAIALETMCMLNKKQQAFSQLKKVAEALSQRSYMSTQTTAYCLYSVAQFVRKFGGSSAMQAVCVVNGKSQPAAGRAISSFPLKFGNASNVKFSVTNNGSGVVFARVVNRGKPAVGEEKEANENIAMSVVYKDIDGNIISPDEISQGTNFRISVTVKNLGAIGEIKNLALNNYIPSGWEIHNSRMDDNEAALKNSPYTYQDIKDDKVLTYFDLQTNETKTFTTLLNAAYEGRYYLPAVSIEGMYDESVYARNKGKWITVVKKSNSGVATK